MHKSVTCPPIYHWNDGGLDRDLYIQTNEVTVLAMDGRRRWLDIQKLVFFLFSNLSILHKRKTAVQIIEFEVEKEKTREQTSIKKI